MGPSEEGEAGRAVVGCGLWGGVGMLSGPCCPRGTGARRQLTGEAGTWWVARGTRLRGAGAGDALRCRCLCGGVYASLWGCEAVRGAPLIGGLFETTGPCPQLRPRVRVCVQLAQGLT